MNSTDFNTTIVVDQSPEVVFNAINNVNGWWSEEVTGGTTALNDVFDYHYRDVHICKMKLIEVIPAKKVVWLVLENYFDFVTDQAEWTGTQVIFEITAKGDQTQLHFTHKGLVPEHECFVVCQKAWTNYIQESLRLLISTGKGQPNPKEGGFNEMLTDEIRKSLSN